MISITKSKQILIGLLVLAGTNVVSAQSAAKLYKQGMMSFYEENFKAAEYAFSKIESQGKEYKDSKYRLEICKLVQKQHREEPLDALLQFEDQMSEKDKFYHYWLGRVYANRYMFAEATESWEKFIGQKGFKSDEIVNETKEFMEHSELLTSYFDNPDNYEVHQLTGPINTQFAEISPVFVLKNDELLFASNRQDGKNDIFKVYQAQNTENGWKEPVALDVMGTFKRDFANIELVNNDGKLFSFKDVNKGDLFYSERKASGWSIPLEFDSKISSTELGSHFYINEHEDRIIFASKKGGKNLDLYESFKNADTGEWEKPHPFSLSINTPYNEDSPFLSPDETKIYFSSDRPNGVGGYDIYVSTFDKASQQWSEPQNMGWPINSPDDEINFKTNEDQKSGYMSSNRLHSKGDYDIYFFWKIEKTNIEGRVAFTETGKPLSGGEILFHPTQYVDEYFRAPIGEDGRYKSELIANEVFRVEVHIGIDTLVVDSFELTDIEGEKITHHKDFFISEKSISKPVSQVKDDKIVANVQGETFGKSTNKNSSTGSAGSTTGSSTKPSNGGSTPASNNSTLAQNRYESNQKEVKDTPTNFTRRNVVLRNLYFEFGTSKIEKESEPRLQEILEYMKANPSKKIEISGHTDNVGSKQLNLLVSQRRAESIKTWLVNKGISTDRIVTNGYGESRPIASNDDEKNGRELNRRIEITVYE